MALKVVQLKVNPLESLVSDYLAHQRGRGLSPRTAALTANVLERTFLPWCSEHDITRPDQLTQRAVDRFQADLLDRKLARESVRTYVRTISTFVKWAGDDFGKLKLQQPTAERKVMDVLDRSEIQRLEDAAELERDKLMIRVLADTGVRLAELLGLRAEDLLEQGRERYAKIRGKGARERLVPIPPALFTRLRRFAKAHEGSRIFATVRRSPKTGQLEPLKARSVQNTLHFIGTAAGLASERCHPHAFRHSYVTHALRKGMNVVTLQHIVGWSSLEMLRVYEHLTVSDSYTAMLELLREE